MCYASHAHCGSVYMSDSALSRLLTLLDLEAIEENLFRGLSPPEPAQRVFGGQVLAQALTAATRTAPPARLCHSLHAYFLRPGDPRSEERRVGKECRARGSP